MGRLSSPGGRLALDRRAFLTGAGAALAAGLSPAAQARIAASDALILAPARRPDGSYAVLVLSEDGAVLREVPMPARGHDLALHPGSGRAVVFARRPGVFAMGFGIADDRAPELFAAPQGRHFFGHGAYAADGRLLFSTENDIAGNRGVIGVYDATDGYRRIGEFPAGGVGTHEAILLPDGRTLAIANGGIETNPTYGRQMLNLPDMDPSLAFLDLTSGHLVAQHRLPAELNRLSIRHMAVAADGAIWFGTQWEGDPLASPPLVGRASLDGGLTLADAPAGTTNAMRRYVGAVAASRDGTVISASAPRGGLVAHWSAETGRLLGTTAIADCSGIAGSAGRGVLAANGEGLLLATSVGRDGSVAEVARHDFPAVSFDNHLHEVAEGRSIPKT